MRYSLIVVVAAAWFAAPSLAVADRCTVTCLCAGPPACAAVNRYYSFADVAPADDDEAQKTKAGRACRPGSACNAKCANTYVEHQCLRGGAPNKINEAIRKGGAPAHIVKIIPDTPAERRIAVEFDNGDILYITGEWSKKQDKERKLTPEEEKWLREAGWKLPGGPK